MIFIYRLSLSLYFLVIHLLSPFHRKARQWVAGRKGWEKRLAGAMHTNTLPVVWMHCSSLGEFEQGRPVIELLREKNPACFILVSFFSPSGYEIRKNYKGADYVCYLPVDSRVNAATWMRLVKPAIALFVKYEYWYEFLRALHREQTPVLLISAIFRKEQIFFKWYGGWFRKMLHRFSILFVQHQASSELLSGYGIHPVRVAGDTRFDRVSVIPDQAKSFPLVKSFAGNKPVLIAGSSWEPDEQILARFINEHQGRYKFILVPHEISSSALRQLEGKLERKSIRFSLAAAEDLSASEVLIIDNVGMLSSLYQYAQIAYIGGGFGKGIHNTLEAATFGLPVLFGPNYARFREAVEMVSRGCAFPVKDYKDLAEILEELMSHDSMRREAGRLAASYVQENTGATLSIVAELLFLLGNSNPRT